jgi:F-type H+-transporting ATPase subunit gamma
MQSIESIRKNIKSAEDLRDIVKTMRTLAAVNIHHFELAVRSLGDYYRSVEMGFQVVLKEGTASLSDQGSALGGTYYIVFGTDQGLCGGFNDQIADYAFSEINKEKGLAEGDVLVCMGERALANLEERKLEVTDVYPLPGGLSGITLSVQQTVMHIIELQMKGKISRVVLFHYKLKSQTTYHPQTVMLLPIDRAWIKSIQEKKWPTHVLPAFTIERDSLFSALFRQYIFVSLFRAFAESMASENAARLLSMQSAEKNIDERIEQLNAFYRSERQNSITSELLDIVSGFEALREENE